MGDLEGTGRKIGDRFWASALLQSGGDRFGLRIGLVSDLPQGTTVISPGIIQMSKLSTPLGSCPL